MEEERRCIDCNRTISLTRKVNKCSNCQRRNYWEQRYEELKAKFGHHKKICSRVILNQYKELKKLNPNIKWGDEPELFMKEINVLKGEVE